MLKRCKKSLVALVLALVAMGVFSPLSSARDLSSARGSEVTAASSVRQPTALTGEPDTPLAPPPSGPHSSPAPIVSEDDSVVDVVEAIRWIGMIWAYWFLGAAH